MRKIVYGYVHWRPIPSKDATLYTLYLSIYK